MGLVGNRKGLGTTREGRGIVLRDGCGAEGEQL